MPPKHLPGTHLEGGGQIIRNALVLSSLLLQPLNITNIRGHRPKGGGLKAQHLAGVEWLSKATSSATVGAQKGSKSLEFRPACHVPYGKDRKRAGGRTVRTVEIDIGTPGSITLLLQAIMPYLLFTGWQETEGESTELEVVMKGGTNVDHSPSVDYIEQVLFHVLNTKVLPKSCRPLEMSVQRRCWGSGKGSEMGLVTFTVPVLQWGEKIPRFQMIQRGDVLKVTASIVVPTNERKEFRERVLAALRREDWKAENVETEVVLDEASGSPKRFYLLLVAHTTSGCRLGRDLFYDPHQHQKSSLKKKSKMEYMVKMCIEDLQSELAHGGCVDGFLEDQLVVFQVLAEGESTVHGNRSGESLHTTTAKWVVSELCGRSFGEDGRVEGIGFGMGRRADE